MSVAHQVRRKVRKKKSASAQHPHQHHLILKEEKRKNKQEKENQKETETDPQGYVLFNLFKLCDCHWFFVYNLHVLLDYNICRVEFLYWKRIKLLTQKRVYIFIVSLYIFVLNEQLEVKNLGLFWVLWSVQSFCPANDS